MGLRASGFIASNRKKTIEKNAVMIAQSCHPYAYAFDGPYTSPTNVPTGQQPAQRYTVGSIQTLRLLPDIDIECFAVTKYSIHSVTAWKL